jgi:hypothetical protein
MQSFVEKGKIDLLKKIEKRAGAADAGQAGPDLRPAQASAGRTVTPPSDPDRTARGSSSPRVSACRRVRHCWLGFRRGGLTEGWLAVGGG